MKAEDLMAGDLVKVKPSGMIIKVAAVHHKKVAYHAIQSKLEWVRQDLLEPIPLTAEILEKNGFKRTEVYDKYEWYNRHSEIWVIIGDTKRHCVHIDSWRREIPTEYHNAIIYVHELQHALRLCGIEEEITL